MNDEIRRARSMECTMRLCQAPIKPMLAELQKKGERLVCVFKTSERGETEGPEYITIELAVKNYKFPRELVDMMPDDVLMVQVHEGQFWHSAVGVF